MRWLTSRLMFLPILSYSDGYGFTYGGRVSTIDLLGIGERLSVPLTWGGTKRAALEFERTFKRGPLTRVQSSVGIWNRENPHYDIDDQRVELKARAERQFTRFFRTGVEAARSNVSFDPVDDRIWTFGADAAFDTRGDPAFPRNAVYLGAGWSALHVNGDPGINRYTADARGYLGVVGQLVLAARAQYFTADAPLPPYEQWLVGGASTLRGFSAGTFIGDRAAVSSAELRLPLTSVLRGAKFGVMGFFDAGKAVSHGERLQDARWEQGAGGGIFIIAPLVQINLDVAHGLRGGPTKLHLGMGFSF
jgi:outer membrane protein assembly factor BamA